MEIDATDYIRSHGKPPRGFGSWAFSPTDPSSRGWSFETSGGRFFHRTTYTEACRLARAWAKEHGYDRLWTLS